MPVLQLEGHQDWIRALSFAHADDGSLLLASASQDSYVRLWKFASLQALAATVAGRAEDELGASFGLFSNQGTAVAQRAAAVARVAADGCDAIAATSLGSRGNLVSIHRGAASGVQSLEFSVILESVLSGHEDWVFSVRWHPRVAVSETHTRQPLCLLTASMDKSMCASVILPIDFCFYESR